MTLQDRINEKLLKDIANYAERLLRLRTLNRGFVLCSVFMKSEDL
jgi:acetolactate synthase regulatory subunit